MYIIDILSGTHIKFSKLKSHIVTGVISLLMAIPLFAPGGYYIIALLDYVIVCIINNLIALLFLIATLWIHGIKKFLDILKY